MTSEIRANVIKNRVGLGTIEYSNTGPIISGVTTALNFKTGTSNLHNTGLNVQDLDVDGHTNLDNVSIAGILTVTSTTQYGGYKLSNNSSIVGELVGLSGSNDTGALALWSGGSKYIQLSAQGNSYILGGSVGIATNSPSSAFLDIASSQATDSLRMRRLSSDSNVASNWSMKPYGGHLYFREGGSTDKIQFMNGGDLNIMDGNLRVASGHGIDFNATSDHGSATPASELLDDYEEGSWTPVLESTSTNPTISSYSKQQGLYTKIGNVVHLFCFIDIAAGNIGGTLTGDGKITGLPFVISNNPSQTDVHGSACDNLKSIPNTFSSQRNNAMLYFPPGQDYLAIHQYNTTNPIYQTGWGMSQIGNGNRFKWAWTGQYRTDQT